MRISSNYYDYYSQYYALNSLTAVKVNAENPDSASETDAAESTAGSRLMTGGSGNIMNVSLNGSMMRHLLQARGVDSAEMSERMQAMKADMDSLESADIDSMTAEEVKEMLAKIKSDMDAMPKPDKAANNVPEIDLDSLSEDEMREMLKDIQAHAKSRPEMAEGMPPMPGGFGPLPMPAGASGDEAGADLLHSGDSLSESVARQIIDKLMASYDASTLDIDDYIEKLREAFSLEV